MPSPVPSRRPNIVLITADQWRGDCLGGFASRHPVMTPHLNQLAAEGAAFTQAYADCPVCIPQRITTLTGWRGSRHGRTYNSLEPFAIDPRASLPGLLTRQAGYQTKGIGKMHFAPERARHGFEHVTLHPNDYLNWLESTPYAGLFRGHGLGGNEVYPAVSAVPEMYSHTHWIVEQGVRFLMERDPNCPFFLWMVFEAPHSPFDPPEPFDRMYDAFTIPPAVHGDWEESNLPPALKMRQIAGKFDQLSAEMLRQTRRRYYGQVTHVDYQLGRFFGALKTAGLYDDTLIAFTADHGEHLGDYGLFGKIDFLQSSGRVPLILRPPAWMPLAHPNSRIDAPVMTLDLFPTLLQAAGLDIPAETDGVSLLDGLAQGGGDERRLIWGESGRANPTAFAAAEGFKYIYHSGGGVEQLFDLVDDPDDMRDLSQDGAFAPQREHLRRQLTENLARFRRPMVQDGRLAVYPVEIDENALRGRNECAWRGPLHYGQGYGDVI